MHVKETPWDPSKYTFPVIIDPQVTRFQAFMNGVTVFAIKDLTVSLCSWADVGWRGDRVAQWPWRARAASKHRQLPVSVCDGSEIMPSLQAPPLLQQQHNVHNRQTCTEKSHLKHIQLL